jgi:hypothetical protein
LNYSILIISYTGKKLQIPGTTSLVVVLISRIEDVSGMMALLVFIDCAFGEWPGRLINIMSIGSSLWNLQFLLCKDFIGSEMV